MTTQDDKASRRRRPAGLRLGLAMLAVWLIAGAVGGVAFRARFVPGWSAPRLDRPIVVIESDDWGLEYQPSVFVPPSAALDERQRRGVELVQEVLGRHRDSAGRRPVLSAFVVVRQADSPAIAADPEHRYHYLPIDQSMPRTVAGLKRAAEKGLFELVYHGRDHRDVGLWCRKVRRAAERLRRQGKAFDPEVVRQFHPRDPRERDRVIAEYFDSTEGYLQPLDAERIDRKVREGLAEFERVFGRRPKSTVPPRYLWDERAERAFAANGLRYVHGVNKQGGRFRGDDRVWARPFGCRLSEGLVGIPRTADLEMLPDGRCPPVEATLAWARRAVDTGQPVVICTHAGNYATLTVQAARDMCRTLGQLLTTLEREYPRLRYLSAEEAGQLAETGRVSVPRGDGTFEEIRTAGDLNRAWLFLAGLYTDRAKVRLYINSLAVLAVLVTVFWLRWRFRRGAPGG